MPSHCPLCPQLHPPIHGDGPTPSLIMVIGEAPARRELEHQRRTGRGKVLVGDSGTEYMEQYLPLAGLTRADVYTTNIVKCASKGLANPTPALAGSCAEYWMHRELRTVQPSIIVTMGAVALHSMFPGHDLETEHGLPFSASWGAWSGIVVPMYHPAAGLRDARFMTTLRGDWEEFGRILGEGLGMDEEVTGRVVDEYPAAILDYQECKTAEDVDEYMGGMWDSPLAVDSEWDSMLTRAPYCMSLSHTPGTSRVIHARSREALGRLAHHLRLLTAPIIYHNALADPDILEAMGLPVMGHPFHDTMMQAYHLGRFSQSLKTLAFRLLGMEMRDFQEVVRPHSLDAVAVWLSDAVDRLTLPLCFPYDSSLHTACQVARESKVPPLKTVMENGKKLTKATQGKLYRDQVAAELEAHPSLLLLYRGFAISAYPGQESMLPHFIKAANSAKTGKEKAVRLAQSALEDVLTNPESDPWKRWKGWSEDVQAELLEAMDWTPMPELSIIHVPWPDAVHYSARDADATIRLYPLMNQYSRGVGKPTL
jgi:uracil-DNA glycosylase family 4